MEKIDKIAGRVYSPNIGVSRTGRVSRSAAVVGSGNGMLGGTSSASSMAQSPLYYNYLRSTPDKLYFPQQRIMANAIWRAVYRHDAVIATGIDLYAELPWSGFGLVGIEDNAIKHIYEDMFTELNLVPRFPKYTRDYNILGENFLHVIFNDEKGYWDKVISFNPDYVSVEGIGLALEQPLLSLHPTPEMQRLCNSPDPRMKDLQKLLPKEIVNSVRGGRTIPLDSLNTTLLARTISENDMRGISLLTRLYRTIMYEDFVVNASLAIAQRHAGPLRIFKLGNMTGEAKWLPNEETIEQFSEMLSLAESDPLAAIIWGSSDVSVDLVGVSDKVLLISKEWDFLERTKLLALGINKAILTGESSFASSITGLQTLLNRLSSTRDMYEHDWMLKKLCTPVAEMNEFYTRTPAELSHRIRTKSKEDLKPILPEIKWEKDLTPTTDINILNLWNQLHDKGLISDRTLVTGTGAMLDSERSNMIEEYKYKQKHNLIQTQQPGTAAPSIGGGSPMPMAPSPGPGQPTEQAPGAPGATPPATPTGSKVNIHDVIAIMRENKADPELIEEMELAANYHEFHQEAFAHYVKGYRKY